jgi:hypothetical protein
MSAASAVDTAQLHFRLRFADAEFDAQSSSTDLDKLRRIFNRQAAAVGRSRNDAKHNQASAAAAAATGPQPAPPAAIPSDFRTWLLWGPRWVEVIDSDSLQMSLEDAHYLASRAPTHTVILQFRAANDEPPGDSEFGRIH